MQAYSPRDPIGEYLTGQITERQLHVMVAHLGPGTPVAREVGGAWTQTDYLLWDMGAQVRLLRAELIQMLTGKKTEIAPFPRPEVTEHQRELADDQTDLDPAVRSDLLAHLNDPARRAPHPDT